MSEQLTEVFQVWKECYESYKISESRTFKQALDSFNKTRDSLGTDEQVYLVKVLAMFEHKPTLIRFDGGEYEI